MRILNFLLLIIFGSVAHASVFELPYLPEEEITIDGKLDEDIYSRLVFHPLSAIDRKEPADPPTTAAMFTNGRILYIAIRAKTEGAVPVPAENDPFSYDRELLEFFIAPRIDQPKYYHWALDTAGRTVSNIGIANANDYNFPWQHATSIDREAYMTEAAIPLDSLELPDGLKRGEKLAVNLCRVSETGGDHLHSFVVLGGSFHQRDLFPVWVAGSFREGAAEELKKMFPNGDGKLQQKLSQIVDAASYRTFLAEMEAYRRKLSRRDFADKGFAVWPIDPFSPPTTFFLPTAADTRKEIQATALRHERITLALGLANVTEKPIRFRVVPSRFLTSGNQKVRTEEACRIQRLVETRLRTGGTQRDALIELDIHDVADCRPGENELVYVTVDTSKLTPGEWEFSLNLEPTLETTLRRTFPITVKVKQTELPLEGEPYSLNFPWYDYMSVSGADQSEAYRSAVLQNQKENGTNFHLIAASNVDTFSISADETGKPIGTINCGELDRQIAVFGVRNQLFLLGTSYRALGCEPGKFDVGELKREFAETMDVFRRELAKRGIAESQIAWYIADEPDANRAKQAVPAAKLLKQYAPKQNIFCTFYPEMGVEPLKILLPYVNLWCPSFAATPEQMQLIGGRARIFYAVSNRTYPPYGAYRLYLWRALSRQASGAAFWSYDDVGHEENSSMWDDFDGGRSDYAVIYEGSRKPQGSIRQLAWFRGIQDWRILIIAQNSPQLRPLAQEALEKVLGTSAPLADSYIERIREKLN